eukprot:5729533-Amphidinium_carterae.1
MEELNLVLGSVPMSALSRIAAGDDSEVARLAMGLEQRWHVETSSCLFVRSISSMQMTPDSPSLAVTCSVMSTPRFT